MTNPRLCQNRLWYHTKLCKEGFFYHRTFCCPKTDFSDHSQKVRTPKTSWLESFPVSTICKNTLNIRNRTCLMKQNRLRVHRTPIVRKRTSDVRELFSDDFSKSARYFLSILFQRPVTDHLSVPYDFYLHTSNSDTLTRPKTMSGKSDNDQKLVRMAKRHGI